MEPVNGAARDMALKHRSRMEYGGSPIDAMTVVNAAPEPQAAAA